MKFYLLLALMLLLLGNLAADDAFPVAASWILTWNQTVVLLDDGNVFVTWVDTGRGNQAIRAQKISPTGLPFWPEPIAVASGAQGLTISAAIPSQTGCVFVLFETNTGIYAQKVDPNGQLLWGQDGINVGTMSNSVRKVTNDGSGGMYIFYFRFYRHLYGQHLSHSGVKMWGDDLFHLYTHHIPIGSTFEDLVPDGEGGVIINLRDPPSSFMSSSFTLRYDAMAYPIGPTPYIQPHHFPGRIFTITQYAPGVLLLHRVIGTSTDSWQLVLRLVGMDGTPISPEAVQYTLNSATYTIAPSLMLNPQGRIAIAWIDANANIRVQSFSPNLDPIWSSGDTLIPTMNATYFTSRASLSPNNLIFCSWLESQNHYRIQCINPDGTPAWPEPLYLGDGVMNMGNRSQVSHDGSTLVFWYGSQANQSGVFYQRVLPSGAMQFPPQGEAVISGFNTEPTTQGAVAVGTGFLVFWQEGPNDSSRLIHYQLYNNSYQPMLGLSGRQLNPDGVQQESYLNTRQINGNKAALLYAAQTSEGTHSYLQEIDAAGNTLLDGPGLRIGGWPAMFGIEGDDYYIGWISGGVGSRVLMGQRIHAGQRMWGENGRVLATIPNGTWAQIQTVQGRYFCFRPGSAQSVRVLAVDQDGNLLPGWDPQGTQVIQESSLSDCRLIRSGILQGKLFCLVMVRISGSTTHRMQLLDPQGQPLWGSDGLPFASTQEGHIPLDAVIGEANVTAIFSVNFDIRVLRINPDGSFPFGSTGLPLSTGIARPKSGSITRLNANLWAIVWDKGVPGVALHSDVYLRFMRDNGELLGDQDYLLCAGRFYNDSIIAVNNGGLGLMTCNDQRAGYYWNDFSQIFYYPSVWAAPFNANWVSMEDSSLAPAHIATLHPNYPNPFNPSTTIAFTLAKPSSSNLCIYNAKGQLVKTLLPNTKLGSGEHSWTWDGKDESGRALATGLYLYRLQAGDLKLTRKMMLIK
ncbi:MAG: FlgD immunoglobulin-like domain containing protein [Candidatus Cloacimonadaceae bacterium]|nr:FlgD immunoglobulin-like domain containing protein [Candidatus Cloacimonadaceae bacterium]